MEKYENKPTIIAETLQASSMKEAPPRYLDGVPLVGIEPGWGYGLFALLFCDDPGGYCRLQSTRRSITADRDATNQSQ